MSVNAIGTLRMAKREKTGRFGPHGAKVASVLVDLDPPAICKGHVVRCFF